MSYHSYRHIILSHILVGLWTSAKTIGSDAVFRKDPAQSQTDTAVCQLMARLP
jgi:hypothetical protein